MTKQFRATVDVANLTSPLVRAMESDGTLDTVRAILDELATLKLEELKAVLMSLKVGKAWGRDD